MFWPEAPAGNRWWTDATAAAEELIAVCIGHLDRWGVATQSAEGELPVPGVYGVPEQWPHVRDLYGRAGFAHAGHTEVAYLAKVEDLPIAAKPPVDGLRVIRSVGINGCRLSAMLADRVIGYIEVETMDEREPPSKHGGWADVGNLRVAAEYRRRGVGTWLLGQAADWLRLANVDRLLDCTCLEGTDPGGVSYDDYRTFLPAVGFRELTRTKRGWTRLPSARSLPSG